MDFFFFLYTLYYRTGPKNENKKGYCRMSEMKKISAISGGKIQVQSFRGSPQKNRATVPGPV